MRRLLTISCAAVLFTGAATGCYIKKEKIHDAPRASTTVERHSTYETVPETRTRTTIEHDD